MDAYLRFCHHYNAATKHLLANDWTATRESLVQCRALLPALKDVDLPEPPASGSIGIDLGSGEVEINVPPRDPHERLRYSLTTMEQFVDYWSTAQESNGRRPA